MQEPIPPPTIYARASGAGRAGVCVVRITGPAAFAATKALAGRLPGPRRAALRSLRDASGAMIDKALVILFKGPCSFTGEDVAELHLHGSPAVERALFEALSGLGLRPAEAGEFTKRALLNGKLDLAEVEGLADLLDAETAEQRKQALGQFGGRLSSLAEGWRARLLAIMTPLEVGIDFPDEEDVPAAIEARAGPEIALLLSSLRKHEQGARRASLIRDGVKIAIIGAPNAGKSSLLNRLAGSERAIVSETPGTTRDIIEIRLDLGGILASFFDTAGLRDDAADPVEREGIRRTRMKAEEADIRILTIDASADVSRETLTPAGAGANVSRETFLAYGRDKHTQGWYSLAYDHLKPGDFIVFNKSDLVPDFAPPARSDFAVHRISAKTGAGLTALTDALSAEIAKRTGGGEDATLTRERHRLAVADAIAALEAAGQRLATAPELAAEDVRLAARALGRITGVVDVEDVLGAIFSSFCIGK
jgi:tRNA modification GTPase